jgi:NAD(P)-dependent dehydrogenase (short-subunit alcohol dehydrogenase family)
MTAGLAGKTAVVTGTAHGIGGAIAEALRGEGARVHGVDKAQANLTNSGEVRDFFGRLGGVDILVNSAGGVCGQVGRPIEDVSDHDWHEVVQANLTSAFLCTRAVAPAMKEARYRQRAHGEPGRASFELAPEFGRVPAYAGGLSPEQEQRAQRLLRDSLVISLPDGPIWVTSWSRGAGALARSPTGHAGSGAGRPRSRAGRAGR